MRLQRLWPSTFHFSARETEAAKYVTRLHARVAESLPGSASLYRLAHGHRVLGGARDGADGPLLRLRQHADNHDRSRLDRPLDRFERGEILRGSLARRHRTARPPAGD